MCLAQITRRKSIEIVRRGAVKYFPIVALLACFSITAADTRQPSVKNSAKESAHTKVLEKFLATLGKDAKTSVVENAASYEVIVSHPDAGGAEMYRVDKRTGTSQMIWHEHPR